MSSQSVGINDSPLNIAINLASGFSCVYFTGCVFGVKIYNTAADKSNFSVTVHTENINCESSTLVVYGSQRANQPTNDKLISNINNFTGQFKLLTLDMKDIGNNVCKYRYTEEKLLFYIFLKVFGQNSAVKVCEVTFE